MPEILDFECENGWIVFLMKSNHMSNPTIIIASHLILSLLLERF